VIRTGSDADWKNGPTARSFAADAHDCIMVRTSTNLPNTSLRREIRLNRELPSDPQVTTCPEERPSWRSSSLCVLRRQGAAKHKRR
jgi:hypothetical protein